MEYAFTERKMEYLLSCNESIGLVQEAIRSDMFYCKQPEIIERMEAHIDRLQRIRNTMDDIARMRKKKESKK